MVLHRYCLVVATFPCLAHLLIEVDSLCQIVGLGSSNTCLPKVSTKIERVSNIISDTFVAFKFTNSRAAIHWHRILVCSMVTVSGTQVLQRHKPCLDAFSGYAHTSLVHPHWSARKITCTVGLLLGND